MLVITEVKVVRHAVVSHAVAEDSSKHCLTCCAVSRVVPLMLPAAVTLVTPASALLPLLYSMYHQSEAVQSHLCDRQESPGVATFDNQHRTFVLFVSALHTSASVLVYQEHPRVC